MAQWLCRGMVFLTKPFFFMKSFMTLLRERTFWAIALFLSLTACVESPPHTFRESDPNTIIKTAAAGAFAGAAVGGLLGTGATAASGPFAIAGAGVGAIAGAALGSAQSSQLLPPRVLLVDAGVQIVEIGEDTMLLLPSRLFFYDDSSHVNEGYYSVLNTVVKFINQYDIQTIKVSGYTSAFGDPERDLALSRQQAQNIANYIQGMGANASFIYSMGYGSLYPIAYNQLGAHAQMNDRVQITFRRLAFES